MYTHMKTEDFSLETTYARRQWICIFKLAKEKCQPRILYALRKKNDKVVFRLSKAERIFAQNVCAKRNTKGSFSTRR